MKKPALIETTVRLFPDKESTATTAPQITSEGHVPVRLYYSPFKSRENLISRILEKGFPHTRSVSKSWKKLGNGKRAVPIVSHEAGHNMYHHIWLA